MSDEIVIDNFVLKNFKQQAQKVTCEVGRGSIPWIKDEQAKYLRKVLEDIGKWESARKLMGDLGLAKEEAANDFQYVKYEVNLHIKDPEYVDGFSFTLPPEEVKRRSKNYDEQDTKVELKKEEIMQQLRNISKWRNLKDAVGLLKAIQSLS
jgi:hypothetical protein